ncbi:30S ribosomal protein S5 [Candidatus Peregrinibacteria bacterium]|nr:MAG: 30S ribosomal protein S5 [Candidatus Peregrinibacteria bacterium]
MAKKPRDNRSSRKERAPKEFFEELLHIARVTRVVKGGRRLRFKATVAIGDRKGRVAVGVGKSAEVATAVQKAVADAKKNVLTIPLTDNLSVPHEVRVKHKAAKILIMPAGEGTGVKAGGVVRKILDLAGVHNVLSKRFGSTTRLVNAQATMIALAELRAKPKKKVKKAEVVVEEVVEENPVAA